MRKSRTSGASSLGETGVREGLLQEADRLRWVLQETGVFPNAASIEEMSPRQVVSLGGGADALTYLVRCPDRDVVVKFNDHGLEAEARALRAWKEHTTGVPDVLGIGRVPSTGSRPVEYLVLGALFNDEGEIVETAVEFLERCPVRAREVGRELGAELHNLHQARCRTGFGNFADSPGAERTYGSWGSYLEQFFMQHADYVTGLGLPGHQVERAAAFMRRGRYVDDPRYLHGDVTIRNIAIRSYHPIKISLFDPNPLCGDPSWDIAPMANNVEFNEAVSRAGGGASETFTRDRELLAGFWEAYPDVIAEESLLTAQLVQAVLQAEHRQDASEHGEIDDRDIEVTHEFIRDVMDRISA